MTWEEVRNNWRLLRDQVRGNWSKLSDEEVAAVAGRRHRLVRLLQSRYELDAESAQMQADAFVRALQVLSL